MTTTVLTKAGLRKISVNTVISTLSTKLSGYPTRVLKIMAMILTPISWNCNKQLLLSNFDDSEAESLLSWFWDWMLSGAQLWYEFRSDTNSSPDPKQLWYEFRVLVIWDAVHVETSSVQMTDVAARICWFSSWTQPMSYPRLRKWLEVSYKWVLCRIGKNGQPSQGMEINANYRKMRIKVRKCCSL